MYAVRLILDTSVIVSAFRSDAGASYRLLRLALDDRFIMLASPAMFLEYEEVLSRPEQVKIHGFELEEVGLILEDLTSVITPVEIRFGWRPQLSDGNDEMVFEAAMNGRADAIVTYNVRDFEPVAKQFGMRVVRPAAVLKEMSG